MQFTEQDQDQILAQGISPEQIDQQINHFVQGFPYLNVIKAATIGDGIVRVKEEQLSNYIHRFDEAAHEKDLVKFVPASGAATRMFKSLFAALDGKSDKSVDEVFASLTDFAFYDDLKAAMAAKGQDLDKAVAENDWQPLLRKTVLQFLLTDEGLEYGSLPKGLLKFHSYADGPRTPVEEHLIEGAAYANSDGLVKIHFTVSPEHRDRFEKLIAEQKTDYEAWLGVTFDISFSEQKKSTDTISVNPDNSPFRNADGTLLFRPAGHGALIENLNDIDADIVFIKNIDNVVPDEIKEPTITYKKVLAAVLLDAQQQVARLQSLLDTPGDISDGHLAEADELFRRTLYTLPPEDFEKWSKVDKLNYFRRKLNRPVRVCGMVKNVGEPGGGPFWARNQDGSVSLQVVESAQIDLTNAGQKAIFDEATHFNPVDLVCGLKDHRGRKYDLPAYRDPQTGFITAKSKDGKDLKAQELPGLWNGAMADWNTIFVEVPLITFNPVKTVNDLLRKEHQPAEE